MTTKTQSLAAQVSSLFGNTAFGIVVGAIMMIVIREMFGDDLNNLVVGATGAFAGIKLIGLMRQLMICEKQLVAGTKQVSSAQLFAKMDSALAALGLMTGMIAILSTPFGAIPFDLLGVGATAFLLIKLLSPALVSSAPIAATSQVSAVHPAVQMARDMILANPALADMLLPDFVSQYDLPSMDRWIATRTEEEFRAFMRHSFARGDLRFVELFDKRLAATSTPQAVTAPRLTLVLSVPSATPQRTIRVRAARRQTSVLALCPELMAA